MSKPKYFYIKNLDEGYYFIKMINMKYDPPGIYGHTVIHDKEVVSFESAEEAKRVLDTEILCHQCYQEKDYAIVYNDGAIEIKVTNF